MRDKRFVAKHRGGVLSKKRHKELMRWACACSEHVSQLICGEVDERLRNALYVAKEWEEGKSSVGAARKAALEAILVARESQDNIVIAVSRSVAHAVAAAHMAEHSIRAAYYALKAVKIAGKSVEEERKWQIEQLSCDLKDIVLDAMQKRGIKI